MSQGCIFLIPPLFVTGEVKGDLCLFPRESTFPDVRTNTQILLSISKQCLQRYCTHIRLIRDKSPDPRELPVKTDERMGKKEVILSSFFIYIRKQRTEKIGHLPKTGSKACKYEFKLNTSQVSIRCHKTIISPKTAY